MALVACQSCQTSDRVFDNVYWRVFKVDPTYSSDDLIASKLLVRRNDCSHYWHAVQTSSLKSKMRDALAGTLNLQQGKLAKAGEILGEWLHPGRWDATHPDRSVQAKEQSPEPTPYSGKITFDGTWYISNNLPYSEYIAYNYSPAAPKAQKDWFTSIANQTGVVFTRQFNKVKP